MKLTPGVDFTNVLPAAFTLTDPKSTKDTDDMTVIYHVIAACKHVGEISST